MCSRNAKNHIEVDAKSHEVRGLYCKNKNVYMEKEVCSFDFSKTFRNRTLFMINVFKINRFSRIATRIFDQCVLIR